MWHSHLNDMEIPETKRFIPKDFELGITLSEGLFTWHRGNFRTGVSSHRFPLMDLHLFTWYHHKSHPACCAGVRISLRYEISQLYHVNTKWPHVSVWNRSASRLERIAHAKCLRFWILRVFYHHEVYLQITRYEMTSHKVNTIRNKKVIPVWNSRRCEFSHVNTPFWPNRSMEQLCNAGLVL